MSLIAENLERVREQIASAAAKSGRSADDVELVAITKTHPAEKVREANEAGQTLFGESRVQKRAPRFRSYRRMSAGILSDISRKVKCDRLCRYSK